MKKILSLVIAFALVLGALCTLIVSAEGEAITVAADKNEIDPGDTVIVTVTLDNASVKAMGVKIEVPEGFEVLVDNFAINDDVTEFKPEGSSKKVKPVMAQDMEDNGDGTYAPAVVTYDEAQVLSGDLLAIEVLSATEIAAGDYTLTVTVSNEGSDPAAFPVTVTVKGEPAGDESEPAGDESEFDFLENAIDGKVNQSVGGETIRVFTPDYDMANSNTKYSINVVLEKDPDSENRYIVKEVLTGNGENFAGELGENEILLAVHSSSSNPEDQATYQNVPGKLAALALEAGDAIIIEINETDGTITACYQEMNAEPVGDESEPAGDESEPAGDESEPAGDESEPAGDESEPAGDESEGEGDASEGEGNDPGVNPPVVGDAGLIALAIASVLAIGGAVIIKKSK